MNDGVRVVVETKVIVQEGVESGWLWCLLEEWHWRFSAAMIGWACNPCIPILW